MSKLQELLDQYCPDGVEKKRIADIASYEQPGKYLVNSTDYSDEFDTPVLTAGQTFVLGYTDEKTGIYPASKDDPVIIFDDFTGAFKWVDFPFKAKSSAMKMIKARGNIVLLRYLYHMMGFLNYTSDEHKRLWISVYSEFEVPVPPIEVQREIVRILDSFTELTTELNTKLADELAARRKQYEYYRDTLLTFPMPDEALSTDTVKWLRIMDCCNIRRGKVISKDYIRDNEGEYPVYSSQTENNGVLGSISDYMYDGEYLTWTTDGANAGTVFYRSGRFNITNVCGLLEPDTEIVNTRYLCFVLNMLAKKHVKYGMGNPKLMSNAMSAIKVPILPMEEQRRIVSILDRFDVICNDLTSGLPAEIAARQKQYEYYRDKLLSFR